MRNLLAKLCAWIGARLIYAAVQLDIRHADKWGVYADDGQNVHIIPLNDCIVHEHDEDCACGPEVIPIKADDGTVNFVIGHHSLDGREQMEEA